MQKSNRKLLDFCFYISFLSASDPLKSMCPSLGPNSIYAQDKKIRKWVQEIENILSNGKT